MKLSDIKEGFIFVLSWSKSTVLCLGKETKHKLLDVTCPKGFRLYLISFNGNEYDNFYDGEWVLGKQANSKIYGIDEIYCEIAKGAWLPIKDMERYKRYPHEYRE